MKLVRFKNDTFHEDMGIFIEPHTIGVKKKSKKTIFLCISISITLIAMILLYLSVYIDNSNGKDIFNKYYNKDRYFTQVRGTDDFYDAFFYLQHKDYKKSSDIFKEIYIKDNENITAKFYYGLNCIELGYDKIAINTFDSIIAHDDNLYIQQSKWCRALSYVKIEEYEKATEELRKIAVDTNNYYHDQAFDVLIDIEKINK